MVNYFPEDKIFSESKDQMLALALSQQIDREVTEEEAFRLIDEVNKYKVPSTSIAPEKKGTQTPVYEKGDFEKERIRMNEEDQALASFLDKYTSPKDFVFTGDSNIIESLNANPQYNIRNRKDAAFGLAKMQSADENIGMMFQRFIASDDEKRLMDPSVAEKRAQDMGADLHFDKPVSEIQLRQAVTAYRRKKNYENAFAYAQATGDKGAWAQTQIIAAGMAGAVGPLELSTTIGASILFPHVGAAVLSKAGTLGKTMMTTAKINHANQILRSGHIASKANRAVSSVKKGSKIADLTDEQAATLMTVKDLASAEKIAGVSKEEAKLATFLDNMSRAKASNLSNVEESLMDTFVFTLADYPFMLSSLHNSKKLGFDLYTEKDMAMDSLAAAGMGIVLPGAVRGALRKLNITPPAVVARNLEGIKTDAKYKAATGEITPEERDLRVKAADEILRNMESKKGDVLKQHPIIEEAINELEQENVSDEILRARQEYLMVNMLNLQDTDLRDLPNFESFLSSISNKEIQRLKTEKFEDVFKDYLIIEKSKNGSYKVRIDGERGYFGKFSMPGLSKADAIKNLSNIYKGYILGDKRALLSAQRALTRYNTFIDDLRNLSDAYGKQVDFNLEVKEGKRPGESAIGINNQIQLDMGTKGRPTKDLSIDQNKEIYSQIIGIKRAFARYLYGVEREQDLFDKFYKAWEVHGYDAANRVYRLFTEEDEQAYKEFFDKWVKMTESKNPNRVPQFDIIGDDKAHRTGLDKFNKFVELELAGNVEGDLSTRALANQFNSLVDAENYFKRFDSARMENIVDKTIHYQKTGDRDWDLLTEYPEYTPHDLNKRADDLVEWEVENARQRNSYDAFTQAQENREALNILDSYSKEAKGDKAGPSHWEQQRSKVKKISEVKGTGHHEVIEATISAIAGSEKLQESIIKYLETGVLKNGVIINIRDALSRALTKNLPMKEIGHINEITLSVINHLREVTKDPKTGKEFLQVFLSPENLEKVKGLNEMTLEDIEKAAPNSSEGDILDAKRFKETVSNTVATNKLFSEIATAIDIELNRLELQAFNDIKINASKMVLMTRYPEYAAEIITGAATQTVYYFEGAARSVEYLTMTGTYYSKNVLKKIGQEGGPELLEYYRDPANQEEIFKAYIAIKHGEEFQGNTYAARIAEIHAKEEASFLGTFSKFGALFKHLGSPIKKSNLRYADVAISSADEQDLIVSLRGKEGTWDPNRIEGSLTFSTNENGQRMVLRNGEYVEYTPELREYVEKLTSDIQEEVTRFFNITNPIYRKIAMWAFRDLDLTEMFDYTHNYNVSLNTIRDALLSGKLTDILEGDLQNLADISKAIKGLRTILITNTSGKAISSVDGVSKAITVEDGDVGALSWVYQFQNGFSGVKSINASGRGASVEELSDVLVFKNAEAEEFAAKNFGYDSMEEYMQNRYERIANARYVLETLGTNPMESAKELIRAFNKALTSHGPLAETKKKIAEKVGIKNPNEKFEISEGATRSILTNVANVAGLQTTATSTLVRWIKLIARAAGGELLVAAGLRSFADMSTVWQGLLTNAYASSTPEAWAMMGEMIKFMSDNKNKDFLDLITACTIVDAEELARKFTGDPGLNLSLFETQYRKMLKEGKPVPKGQKLKKESQATTVLDKAEMAVDWYSNALLNRLGHMSDITNSNKRVAALCIQRAIADYANMEYKALPVNLQNALKRDSINEADWNFIRNNCIWDVGEYAKHLEGFQAKGKSFNMLIPHSIDLVSDEAIIKELKARGLNRVKQGDIDDFRQRIMSQMWNIVEGGSNEMVSIPSTRVANIMRLNLPKGSGWGTVAELVTQFQSFGVSLLFSTYGKRLAQFAERETGISLVDLFNPSLRLEEVKRPAVYRSVGGMIFSIAMANLLIDVVIRASKGDVIQPFNEDGEFTGQDLLRSAAFGALGSAGVFLNALWEGVEGSGQRGGGFAIQVLPSISNLTRRLYRLGRPLTSDDIAEGDKLNAFLAASAQELARASGLKTLPVVALAWQALLGARLDMISRGGYNNYYEYLRTREKRSGRMPLWYDTNLDWLTDEWSRVNP